MKIEDWQKILAAGEADKQKMLNNIELSDLFAEAIKKKIEDLEKCTSTQ